VSILTVGRSSGIQTNALMSKFDRKPLGKD
jgi:hypothetical protein